MSSRHFVSSLCPTFLPPPHRNKQISKDAFVRLRHVATSTWVRSLPHDSADEDASDNVIDVVAHIERDDREAFAISPVSALEIRDLDFCSDSYRVLAFNARRLKSGTITSVERRQLAQLLTDLIMFVMNQESVRFGLETYGHVPAARAV